MNIGELEAWKTKGFIEQDKIVDDEVAKPIDELLNYLNDEITKASG